MVSRANVAAQIMEHLCTCPEHGYSQYSREGSGGYCTVQTEAGPIQVRKGDRDCSSSTSEAWMLALRGTPYDGRIKITSTHYMRDMFVQSGLFEWRPMSFIAQRGDLYLKDGSHVAMCTSPNPDMLAEFSISETGGIDGQAGDQTGRESSIHGYYDYPWNGILHYNGKADSAAPKPEPPKPQPKPKGYSTKLYQSNNTPMQQFRIEQATGGWVRIKSVGRGMYLDVYDGAKADHTPVRVWEGNGSAAQLWKLIPVQGTYSLRYELEPKCAKGMRLDAIDGGTANKTGLQLHPDNDTAAQRWQFIDSGDGIYRIASSKSGLVIDCGPGVQ